MLPSVCTAFPATLFGLDDEIEPDTANHQRPAVQTVSW
jgi:hypothetical protein